MKSVTIKSAAGVAADGLPAHLRVSDYCLSAGDRIILDEIGFKVRRGEVCAILGPNGSGKSTLLRCMLGLVKADRGTAFIDDRPLNRHRQEVGIVFQQPSLDRRLSAAENLLLGARLYGVKSAEAKQRAQALLEFLDLLDRADDRVETLSGGAQRRLEIARALIHQPSLLLLDEPTTGLDMQTFRRVWKRLRDLAVGQELAVVTTTHRADEAAMADHIIILDRGRVVADDSPEELLRQVGKDIIQLECAKPEWVAEQLREHFLLNARIDADASLRSASVQVEVEAGHTWVPRIVEAFAEGTFAAITCRRPTLADAFFHLTGHPLGAGDASGSAAGQTAVPRDPDQDRDHVTESGPHKNDTGESSATADSDDSEMQAGPPPVSVAPPSTDPVSEAEAESTDDAIAVKA